MSTVLTHVGFGHYLATGRILAIAAGGSAPIKRSIQNARDKHLLIDLTNGRKTKAVVFTDCQYLVLVALEPSTINGRLGNDV